MSLRGFLMWLLLVPLLVYAAILGLLYVKQTDMLFPVGEVPAVAPRPGANRLELTAASGDRLRGLHIPASGSQASHTLVLGFGGNASNADGVAAMLHDLYPTADVVVFHYRGYPPSGGQPGAAAMQEDAPRVHDVMRARLRPDRVIAVGCSIGSGVAASLAAARPLDGLILVTPFDSLGAVAAGHYPWLPVRLLMRHRLEPARDLAAVRTPVAIIAAGSDRLIPAARTDALRTALPNLRFDRVIAGAGHNDIYAEPRFRGAMAEALVALIPGESRS